MTLVSLTSCANAVNYPRCLNRLGETYEKLTITTSKFISGVIAILAASALTLITLSLSVVEAITIDPIVNGRFETGNLAGWKVSIPLGQSQFAPLQRPAGTIRVESSDFLSVPTPPEEGNYFLAVGTAETGDVRFPENKVNVTASQSLKLDSGDILSGWSSFYNGDYIPQDSAWVKILGSSGTEVDTPWYKVPEPRLWHPSIF